MAQAEKEKEMFGLLIAVPTIMFLNNSFLL